MDTSARTGITWARGWLTLHYIQLHLHLWVLFLYYMKPVYYMTPDLLQDRVNFVGGKMCHIITIQLVLQQCCKMSNLRSGVLPLLFGRRGEKDAWYIYFTCCLPIVQKLTFVWSVKNKRSFGALHRLVKEHIWLPELLDRFCRPHLFMTETTRWSRNLLTASLSFNATIADKIVETYSNRVTSENRRIHTPPLSPPFKVGVFVVF